MTLCSKENTVPAPLVERHVDVIVWKISNTFVTQLAHVHLQSEQRKHHQTEDGQRHDFGQLLERMQQRIDDGLQACLRACVSL